VLTTISHIVDPWAAATAIAALSDQLKQFGYRFSLSNSFDDLVHCRLSRRSGNITPFFDPEVSGLEPSRFFWVKLSNAGAAAVGLQAFRCDDVTTSLLDWAPTYHIGLYMRRKELCVPTFATPPASSRTHGIRGRLVYHGELWLDPHIRNRNVLNAFARLGIILSYVKWNADAVWALASQQMATHGHAHRMGYSHVESGFLKWDWAPEGNPLAEYLLLSERHGIEHIISEVNLSHTNETEADNPKHREQAQVLPFRLSEYQREQVL
jgi:hypothetical protein